MKRKHYNEIIAWANGAAIQGRPDETSGWEDINTPCWYDQYQYRVKPKTIMIGDMEVPEPVRTYLENGTDYWVTTTPVASLAYKSYWNSSEKDFFLLNSGMIHLTEENAVLHAKALIKVSGGTL